MKTAGLREEWLIFDSLKSCVYQRISIEQLDLVHHVPPEETFLQRNGQRKALAAQGTEKFPLRNSTAISDVYINSADAKADGVVWYKDLPLCDERNRVFLNHDVVELERRRGKKTIVCLKFVDSLDDADIMAIVLRKLSRSNSIPTMARIELIRIARDEMNFDFETISKLIVSKYKGKKTLNEVINEYRAAKVYEELGTFKPAIGGRCLADMPEAFSKVKFLMGRAEIREEMERSLDARMHFVNMAVSTTILREKRFQDLVPKMLRHEETRKTLFEDNYSKAKATLNRLYPEQNKQTYPYLDLVSASQKLDSPEILRMVGMQIENNPTANPILMVLLEIIEKVTLASPSARTSIQSAIESGNFMREAVDEI